MITFQYYEEKYFEQIAKLFDDFQGYLVHVDPLKRSVRVGNYGHLQLDEALGEVKENNGVFYVALDDEKVVGFIVGVIQKLSKEDKRSIIPTKTGRIKELYIDAAYRGRGIGTKLMKKVEKFFNEQKCDAILVGVFAPNVPARKFYEEMGYSARNIDLIKLI